jgi:hypothetical protein
MLKLRKAQILMATLVSSVVARDQAPDVMICTKSHCVSPDNHFCIQPLRDRDADP